MDYHDIKQTMEFEITEYGNLLRYKKEFTPEFVKKTIKSENLNGLSIFVQFEEERLTDLEFLKNYTFLEGLEIFSRDDYDFSFLHDLIELKTLSITSEGKNLIDVTSLKKLESLTLKWRKNIVGITNLSSLTDLTLIEFKEHDFRKISNLAKLRKLIIKTSTVITLEGVQGFRSLEYLLLGYCKNLISIRELNDLAYLSYLDFDTCIKVKNFSSLANLPSLKTLKINDCKIVDSIKFIKSFPLLERFEFLGNTKIEDGDLSPAYNIKDVRPRVKK